MELLILLFLIKLKQVLLCWRSAMTGGDVLIKNVIPKHLEAITAKLEEIGARS